ncbi:MAG: RHS repeat-associated core domain-containing protein [Firmicutes bacterium]|nr:RHS repeat-associated core domain-containing protein [Bacillota bacterium]
MLVEDNGNIAVRYVYDAWGNHKAFEGDSSLTIYDSLNGVIAGYESHIGNLNPFRYRGYYFDVETGLYYLLSRYYDPQVGRFINADAVDYANPGILSGLNLYAYCGNNPVMRTDPKGKHWYFLWIDNLFENIGKGIVDTIDFLFDVSVAVVDKKMDDAGIPPIQKQKIKEENPILLKPTSPEANFVAEIVKDVTFYYDISVGITLHSEGPVSLDAQAGYTKVIGGPSYFHIGSGLSSSYSPLPINFSFSMGIATNYRDPQDLAGWGYGVGGGYGYGFEYGSWVVGDTDTYAITLSTSYGIYFNIDYYFLIGG